MKIPDMIPAVGFKRFRYSVVGPFEWQCCNRHDQELRICMHAYVEISLSQVDSTVDF